jgi:cathepsin L
VEYQKQYGCIDHSSDNSSTPLLHYTPLIEGVSLPEAVDWNTKGAVAEVKDQGDCCASYAFSAVGTVEGMEALASGELKTLSEQNIIDCSGPYGNHGCVKGSIDKALEYVVDEGINTQDVYPFQGAQKKCHYKSGKSSATLRSFQRVKRGNEEDLMSAVAMEGPIAAGIDASHNTFRFYDSGIYDQPTCSSRQLNHAILIVGYATDDHGKDYWIVKNSWGTSWGEDGYVRMSRNRSNQCGIATRALFPTL